VFDALPLRNTCQGRLLQLHAYCFRHGASSSGNAVRSWDIRAKVTAPLARAVVVVVVVVVVRSLTRLSVVGSCFSGQVRDVDDWTTLDSRRGDTSVGTAPGSVALFHVPGDPSWTVVPSDAAPTAPTAPHHDGYRYFLFLQLGPNSSGNDCLFIGGMELYGTLTLTDGVEATAAAAE
jgi:hypothetical protein